MGSIINAAFGFGSQSAESRGYFTNQEPIKVTSENIPRLGSDAGLPLTRWPMRRCLSGDGSALLSRHQATARRWPRPAGASFAPRQLIRRKSSALLLCLFARRSGTICGCYAGWSSEKRLRLKRDLPYTRTLLLISILVTISLYRGGDGAGALSPG